MICIDVDSTGSFQLIDRDYYFCNFIEIFTDFYLSIHNFVNLITSS